MRRSLAWMLGGFALFNFLRRKRPPESSPDPRAEELRQRLAESRELVEEREVFEAGETPIDKVEPAPPQDPAARRRDVHESAREVAERMRESRD